MSRNKFFSLVSIPLLSGLSLNAFANEPIRAGSGTLGFSVGASAPSDSLNLNSIAIRYRVNHRLTFEPMVKYTQATVDDTSTSEEYTYDDEGNETVETVSSTTETAVTNMEFGLNVRYRLGFKKPARSSAADLYGLVGVGYTSINSESSVEGSDVTSTDQASGLAVNVGVGIEGWINQHWSAGIDAYTMLYGQMSGESDLDGSGGPETESAMTAISVSPQLRLSINCYF